MKGLRILWAHVGGRSGWCVPGRIYIHGGTPPTFDEERMRAACRLIERTDRSGKTIYLTHHKHVVDIAQEVCETELVLHGFEEWVGAGAKFQASLGVIESSVRGPRRRQPPGLSIDRDIPLSNFQLIYLPNIELQIQHFLPIRVYPYPNEHISYFHLFSYCNTFQNTS